MRFGFSRIRGTAVWSIVAAGATCGAMAQEIVWGDPSSVATNTDLSLAFNNARSLVRSRDGARAYLGWKQSDGLWFVVLSNSAVTIQFRVSSNANATALAIEEAPDGEVIIAHGGPGAITVRSSTNHGVSFDAPVSLAAPGIQSNPSISFTDDGEGCLVWHSAASPSVVYGSRRDASTKLWSSISALETNLTDGRFASVWARGGPPVVCWRADVNPLPPTNWGIRFFDWSNNAAPISIPTTNCFDPSVWRDGNRVWVSYFNTGQEVLRTVRSNDAAAFAPAEAFAGYVRFPHIGGNARGVMAIVYEYTDTPVAATNDSLKQYGIQLSFDAGASFSNAPSPQLAGVTTQVFSTCWVSDGWVDLAWVDRGATPPVLKYQTGAIIYPPEISAIALDGTNAVISLFASAGLNYTLEEQSALSGDAWTSSAAAAIEGTGAEAAWRVGLAPTGTVFFRVLQQ